MIRLNDILEEVSKYRPDGDLESIKRAYVYSAKVHQGQIRKSGEPYLIHPLEVAQILAQMRLDEASIVSGILHDTIEDTLATKEELQELFGTEVAEIVDGVTKLGQYTSQTSAAQVGLEQGKSKEQKEEEKQAENFRKMLVAMAKDLRVILVKLADRTHNMRTMDSMKPEKQARIAQETLDIYAPLANRLGISWVKVELEDLSFKYLKPDDYKALTDEIAKSQKDREKYIADVVKFLETKLKEWKLSGKVSGRPKHLYSIYKKLKSKGVGLESIHDVIAFRVIVPTVADCYQTLGMVHGAFKPVPGRFKDFIAIPKANNYQSLHTTVIGPGGDRIEIQIRTEEMHRIAEEGVAAHWAYKEGKAAVASTDEQKFAWLRQMMEWQKELKDPREFLDTVKVDLFQDEVFVFTPKGDVKALPRGAVPVDFAYAIHSKVGDATVGAKVNGRIVPLRSKLKNGDVVEILTASNAHPSKDWLGYVKTAKAQNRIRAYIRQQEREKSIELGKDLADREFKRYGLNWSRFVKDETELVKAANEFGYRSVDDVTAAIGIGKVTPSQLISRLAPEKLTEQRPGEEAAGPMTALDAIIPSGRRLTDIFKKIVTVGQAKAKGGVRINGIDDVLVKFGKCCAPVPGDAIGGFITRGHGVSVHVRTCPKLAAAEAERRIDVTWDVKSDYTRPVTVRVTSDDRAGLLARMTEVFSSKGISIVQANARALTESRAVSTFEVGIRDLGQLRDVISAMERLEGVHLVERL
jgi:GTP pyrophosphokinase